jgi:hypothetical protein
LRVPEQFGGFSCEVYLFHMFSVLALLPVGAAVFRTTAEILLQIYGSYPLLAAYIAGVLLLSTVIGRNFFGPANRVIRRALGSVPVPRSPHAEIASDSLSAVPSSTR